MLAVDSRFTSVRHTLRNFLCQLTLHDLHRQTKLASPRLPETSFVSFDMSGHASICALKISDISTDADPIGVHLSA